MSLNIASTAHTKVSLNNFNELHDVFLDTSNNKTFSSILDSLSKEAKLLLYNAFVVRHISKDTINILKRILKALHEQALLKSFDDEVLSRLPSCELITEMAHIQKFEQIMRAPIHVIEGFIQFATSYFNEYYTPQEFSSLLSEYSELLRFTEILPTTSFSENVPCYNQGGKEWLTDLKIQITSENMSKVAAKAFVELPSEFLVTQKNIEETEIFKKKIVPLMTDQRLISSQFIHVLSLQHIWEQLLEKSRKKAINISEQELVHIKKLLDTYIVNKELTETQCVTILGIVESLDCAQNASELVHFIQMFKLISQTAGAEVFSLLSNSASYRERPTIDAVMEILKLIYEIAIAETIDIVSIKEFYNSNIGAESLRDCLSEQLSKIQSAKFPEKSQIDVIKSFKGEVDGSQVSYLLDSNELEYIIKEYDAIEQIGKTLKKDSLQELAKLHDTIRTRIKTKGLSIDEKYHLLAIAREAICKKFGIYPHITQMFTLLGLLNYPSKLKGRIAQVLTGEGKSTVITMLALYLASAGHSVDLISSTRYLAVRDQKKYKPFFDAFGITTSHICKDKRSKEDFSGQIIYGTNYDYKFSILEESLYDRPLRVQSKDGKETIRSFDVAIIDEIDNLFIDSALNSARMAVPRKVRMNWIYPSIVTFVQENKDAIAKFIDDSSSVNKEHEDALISKIKKALLTVHALEHKEVIEQLTSVKLANWLKSAYKALYILKPSKDYVIVSLPSDSGEKEQQIVIVDKINTGRLQIGMRWPHGLHQFLELKHHLKVREDSVVPASLCHSVTFSQYSRLFGLSGTVGTKTDRKEIEDIYSVDTFDVPPHNPNCFKKLDPILCSERDEQYQKIFSDIKEMQASNRPTLILFESIEDTTAFSEWLNTKNISSETLNELQIQNEDYVVVRAGLPGTVTIATNAAGRGTDIILHPTSKQSGGMHIILTFYPENERVERQGFGRSGRQGQPGSGRMILNIKNNSLLHSLSQLHPEEALPQPLKILQELREINNARLSEVRVRRSKLEKIKHSYLASFFEKIQTWQKALNEKCVEHIASEVLQNLKKGSSDSMVSELSEAEKELSQQLHNAVDRFKNDIEALKSYISGVRQVQHMHILTLWAENFFEQLDDIEEDSLSHVGRGSESLEELCKTYSQKVEELHKIQKVKWEKYLTNPEDCFRKYLQLIMS